MTKNICTNCQWGEHCSTDGGCEHYDPLDEKSIENEITAEQKIEYDIEWQTYVNTWRGNDKWGDSYDEI